MKGLSGLDLVMQEDLKRESCRDLGQQMGGGLSSCMSQGSVTEEELLWYYGIKGSMKGGRPYGVVGETWKPESVRGNRQIREVTNQPS